MIFQPLLASAAGVAQFEGGPRLRVTLETTETQGALIAELELSTDDRRQLHGTIAGFAGWQWQATLHPIEESIYRWRCELEITAGADAAIALTVRLDDLGPEPRWLIPATFYDANRPADSPRRYPRWGDESEPWTATAWCFSAERAAAPFTSVQTEQHSAALIADSPYWNDTIVGLGLSGADRTSLLLRYPYAETPRSYAPCRGDDCAPVIAWHSVTANQRITIGFEIVVAEPQPVYKALL
ncbi:MAG TPA: hypothetical protein VGD58_25500, partial [Herpetosiphonaceae bacterium]